MFLGGGGCLLVEMLPLLFKPHGFAMTTPKLIAASIVVSFDGCAGGLLAS